MTTKSSKKKGVIRWLTLLLGGGLVLCWFVTSKTRRGVWVSGWAMLSVKYLDVHSEWPVRQNDALNMLSPLRGQNLLSVSLGSWARRLEQLAWVDTAVIRKVYPNRVKVFLTATVPKAILLVKRQPYFINRRGSVIDRASPSLMARFSDLPALTKLTDGAEAWPMENLIAAVEKIQSVLGSSNKISQIHLDSHPNFRFYLTNPRSEIMMNLETWEESMVGLSLLLKNLPRHLTGLRRIQLLSSKKAVVSSVLSN